MKNNFKRLIAITTSVILVICTCICATSLPIKASAEGVTLNILDDGKYVGDCTGHNDGRYITRGGVNGIIADGKAAVRVAAVKGKENQNDALYLASKSLSDVGLETAKTLSYFIKTDENMKPLRILLSNYIADSSEETKLTSGTYYLLNTEDNTAVAYRFEMDNGFVTVPSGFTGYVVFDLETATNAETFLSTDLSALRFWYRAITSEEEGTVWYYGEVAASNNTAAEVINYYSPKDAFCKGSEKCGIPKNCFGQC